MVAETRRARVVPDEIEAPKSAALLAPEVQNLIGVVMNKKNLLDGIGPLDGDDVRQHLQLVAFRAEKRWDGSTKFTTYLWPRLHGEADSIIRSYGTRDRYGNERLPTVELSEMQGATDGALDGLAEEMGLADAITQLPQHLRITLYLRFYEGLTVADAACRMGATVGMVCAYEYAAIVQLRLLLSA